MKREASEREALNLAQRPFVNSRPVVRITLLLWLFGMLLLLGNASLFYNYLEGSKEKRAALAAKDVEIQKEQDQLKRVDERFSSLDLTQQNRQVLYLNRKIRDRTFSWSLLFDRLAQVLPNEVRLDQLAPRGVVGEHEPQKNELDRMLAKDNDQPVVLSITGQAKNTEALLALQDHLYGHPAFDYPNVSRQSIEEKDNLWRFDMTVQYRPGAVVPGTPDATLSERPAAVPPTPTPTPAAARPAAPRSTP